MVGSFRSETLHCPYCHLGEVERRLEVVRTVEEVQRSERCCLCCHLGLGRLMGEVRTVAVVRMSAGFQVSAAAAEWEEDSSSVADHRLGEEDSAVAAALRAVSVWICVMA